MNLKQTLIYTVVVVALTAGVTKYMWPNIETKIKVEEKEVIKKDIRTIIKERIDKDGNITKETEIIDRSKEKNTKEYESITIAKKEWFVAVGAQTGLRNIDPVYNAQVNRRIIGPVYLGGSVNTRGDLGVQIGMEF